MDILNLAFDNRFTVWLEQKVVKRVVVVVRETETNEPLERWQFEIQNQAAGDSPSENTK